MIRRVLSLFLLILFVFLLSCVEREDSVFAATASQSVRIDRLTPLPQEDLTRLKGFAASLTTEQNFGQLFIIHLPWTHKGSETVHLTQAEKNLIREIQPGGVILYAVNLDTLEQVRTLVREIRALCVVPPFIAVDEEGGRVSRLNKIRLPAATRIPPAQTLSDAGPSAIRTAYSIIGLELSIAGINMDFAPVADLPYQTDSDIIGDRAFGKTFEEAANFVSIATKALADQGVVPVLKHFPGHGRSRGDTHFGLQKIEVTWEELLQTDLVPFKRAFAMGAPAVMTAHISYPLVDKYGQPASVSSILIGTKLRQELGFDGLVITDALDMQGIVAATGTDNAAIDAIKAGVDMVLSPGDPIATRDAMRKAVADGRLEMEFIDKAVNRIVRTKERFGILANNEIWTDPAKAATVFGSEVSRRVLSKALLSNSGIVGR